MSKLKTREALEQLTKEQVMDLIVWQMFVKSISVSALIKRINERQDEIVRRVNAHLKEIYASE